ncbi:MAG: pilus assembly protein [Bryobacteraceae bacterium]|nr:pilus assembly protein [Solibacteraceae bacterium]MCL4841256.1 pilus assembly protein [Bryobacteraceae bacterium]MCO5353610.1 pilus assembly protein [Bryobacteraceae bacterium]
MLTTQSLSASPSRPGIRRRPQRGNTIVEFAAVALFLTPLLLGTFTLGMNLNQSVRVTQVVRDAGHMYARFVDFTLPSNQDILVRLAIGLRMTRDGGDGVIILSKVTYLSDDDCTGAGVSLADCANRGNYVITNRVVVGNPSLRASDYGTPSNTSLDSSGNTYDIYRDTSVRATNFGSVLTLNSGQFAFVAEGLFRGAGINLTSSGIGNDVYSRAIF